MLEDGEETAGKMGSEWVLSGDRCFAKPFIEKACNHGALTFDQAWPADLGLGRSGHLVTTAPEVL
jgi:hypothetical protein